MKVQKKKPMGKLLAYGLGSAILYACVYLFQEPLLTTAAKGGMYTVVPIATVFLFSWVHGTFAGTLWEVLGVNAVKKASVQAPVAAPRKDTRPRATVNA